MSIRLNNIFTDLVQFVVIFIVIIFSKSILNNCFNDNIIVISIVNVAYVVAILAIVHIIAGKYKVYTFRDLFYADKLSVLFGLIFSLVYVGANWVIYLSFFGRSFNLISQSIVLTIIDTFIGALFEEFVFRLLLFVILVRNGVKTIYSIIICSIAFSLGHFAGIEAHIFEGLIYFTSSGIVLALLFKKASFLSAIIFHSIFNISMNIFDYESTTQHMELIRLQLVSGMSLNIVSIIFLLRYRSKDDILFTRIVGNSII
jgi:membrane protease YdiL (CAAX protease family)